MNLPRCFTFKEDEYVRDQLWFHRKLLYGVINRHASQKNRLKHQDKYPISMTNSEKLSMLRLTKIETYMKMFTQFGTIYSTEK